MTDCPTKLTQARQALHDLLTGTAVVSLTIEGEQVQYNRANQAALRSYIQELEAECGTDTASARRKPGKVYF